MFGTPKVVLSTGAPKHPMDAPAPARLVVSVDLGHSFRAVPLDAQRHMIESALELALTAAYEKLDELAGVHGVTPGEAVAA